MAGPPKRRPGDPLNPPGLIPPSNNRNGYATPETRESSRADISRLSQTLEPLSLRPSNGHRVATTGSISPNAGDPVNALGAGVNLIKEAIDTISKLQGLGLEQYNIKLPKCAVLGEQSTGKSSVIEAISGIKTPRSTDTCTRCPLYIKMEPADDANSTWHANVSLILPFQYDGKTTRDRRFPGWLEQTPITVPFVETDSPDELEQIIARAQLAILNGGAVDPQTFLNASLRSLQQYNQVEFSPNYVCIEISKPGLPPLSFFDLPGIIGQAEDPRQVKFVKDLVTEYIRDPESLILVTCSLNNDIHNSTAAGIAREQNATGRCVGVLTKPDCRSAGEGTDTLSKVLSGERFPLGHGYFVVKNPGQDAINQGITHSDARASEHEFFRTTAPWSTPSFEIFQHRFGTSQLQSYLSNELAKQTSAALPNLGRDIKNLLSEVEQDLDMLPESPTYDAIHIVNKMLQNFSRHVEKEMGRSHGYNKWRNIWDDLQKGFSDRLSVMRPKLSMTGDKDKGLSGTLSKGKSPEAAIVIDSDASEDEDSLRSPTPEPSPSKKRKMEGIPIKTHMTPAPSASRARGLGHFKGKAAATSSQPDPVEDMSGYENIFQLDEVATSIMKASKQKLPGEIDPKVLDDMICGTIQNWNIPTERLFNELEASLRDHLRTVFDEYFGKWCGAEIYPTALKIVENVLEGLLHKQRHIMAPMTLDDELKGPFMFYRQVWDQEKSLVQALYQQTRYTKRLRQYFQEVDKHTGKETSATDREAKARKDPRIHSKVMEEPYRLELDAMSKITSYYIIASRRFFESICMRVESGLFFPLETALLRELDKGLEIGGPNAYNNCVRLLEANPDRLAQRQRLLKKKDTLLAAQKHIQDVLRKYDVGPIKNGADSNGNGEPSESSSDADGMPGVQYTGRSRG